MSELPEDWERHALSGLVDEDRGICYGIVQPGSHARDGVPIVRVNNIKFGRIETNDALRVSSDIEAKYRRSRLRGGEVLLTLVGSLGESAVVPTELAGWNVARAVGVIPVKPEIGSRWVELCLRSSLSQNFIGTRATTTVQATFNLRDLANIPIPLPPKKEREAIASVLGALDDKIELNRRMNETLEAMARALFQNWFVDATQAGLPKDWRESTVDEEFNLTMGQSPPGESYNETGDGIPFYQGRTDFGFRYPTARIFCTAPTRFANAGDTLVSVRAPVGSVNMAAEKCPVGRGVAAVRHKSGSRSYTYYFMRSLEPDFARFEADGTVFGSINKANFHAIKRATPPPALVEAFEKLVFPIDQRIENNENESRTLAALHDALLPKLLSGELRVPAAAKLVEGCYE